MAAQEQKSLPGISGETNGAEAGRRLGMVLLSKLAWLGSRLVEVGPEPRAGPALGPSCHPAKARAGEPPTQAEVLDPPHEQWQGISCLHSVHRRKIRIQQGAYAGESHTPRLDPGSVSRSRAARTRTAMPGCSLTARAPVSESHCSSLQRAEARRQTDRPGHEAPSSVSLLQQTCIFHLLSNAGAKTPARPAKSQSVPINNVKSVKAAASGGSWIMALLSSMVKNSRYSASTGARNTRHGSALRAIHPPSIHSMLAALTTSRHLLAPTASVQPGAYRYLHRARLWRCLTCTHKEASRAKNGDVA